MLYMYNKRKIPMFAIFDQKVLHCFHRRLNEEKYKEGFLLPETFKLLGGCAQFVRVRQSTTAHWLTIYPGRSVSPRYITLVKRIVRVRFRVTVVKEFYKG